MRYGTILTGEKYYMEWKPDGFHENEDERDPEDARIMTYCEKLDNLLLQQIYQMFDKKRFIDLIENFVVYDKGIKKVCRYNQFYGIKRTQRRVAKQHGGIIWHTQGSGKTLTMVWLSKWILANCEEENPRVLIVTDRDELDEQIEKTYIGVDEKITRTKSCDDLLQKLNSYDDSLLCSLVHKFDRRGGEATESDYNKYIDELKKALPADFKAKGKIFVFVDECHRTQSGKLHAAMQAIMPEAIFIGFTGTPLLKKDKKTSIEVWIKKQIEKFQQQPRSAKRQYVSGETMYIWGKQYYLSFVPDAQKNSFEIQGDKVILSMREDSTVKQRENYVREQYRSLLKVEIERLLPKWEQITELHCESWQTKYMVTRWGTCNTEKKKLWFNLQLAQKPIECLEYVILHELIHLRERTHNSTFIAYMDMYMKNWRAVRKELNDSRLDYYDAQDESPLQKLIDQRRYDEIKDAVLDYMTEKVKENKATLSDIEIQNMGLSIIEDSLLSSELDIFGLVVFEDGNIKDKNKNIVIRNAKRGTVLIDPRVYYERTLGTVNFTIAHECFHWYRHQPYHALMKMLGANDELGKIIQCSIGSNAKDSEKWKAVDWMEWQANGVAPHILMPTNTAKIKISELIEKYHIHFDGTDGYQIEEMISELADFYGLSKQAVKMRIREMGFAFDNS